MFEVNDRRRIYWLIDKYLDKKIDTLTFVEEYHNCFDIEVDVNDLSTDEKAVLCELSDISNRYSESDSDHRNYPGVYFTEQHVREKAQETKKKLADYWPPELQNH